MLTSAAHLPSSSRPPLGPTAVRLDRVRSLRRIDGLELTLRRLVDSCEPAVVFSSLVRLCVPAFSDTCSVDVVEGDRMGYRVSYPARTTGPTSTLVRAERSLVIAFEADLPGWASYTGVMTCVWHTRRPTAEDQYRAEAIVDHGIRMVRRERLAELASNCGGR